MSGMVRVYGSELLVLDMTPEAMSASMKAAGELIRRAWNSVIAGIQKFWDFLRPVVWSMVPSKRAVRLARRARRATLRRRYRHA